MFPVLLQCQFDSLDLVLCQRTVDNELKQTLSGGRIEVLERGIEPRPSRVGGFRVR